MFPALLPAAMLLLAPPEAKAIDIPSIAGCQIVDLPCLANKVKEQVSGWVKKLIGLDLSFFENLIRKFVNLGGCFVTGAGGAVGDLVRMIKDPLGLIQNTFSTLWSTMKGLGGAVISTIDFKKLWGEAQGLWGDIKKLFPKELSAKNLVEFAMRVFDSLVGRIKGAAEKIPDTLFDNLLLAVEGPMQPGGAPAFLTAGESPSGLYMVASGARSDGAKTGPRLWLRGDVKEEGGKGDWQDLGPAAGLKAIAAHDGRIYVVVGNELRVWSNRDESAEAKQAREKLKSAPGWRTQWPENSAYLKHIAVAADGSVYGVTAKKGKIVRWTGFEWALTAPLGGFSAVAVGSGVEVWAIGPGSALFRFDGDEWEKQDDAPTGVVSLAVTPKGQVYAVNGTREIHRYDGIGWKRLEGPPLTFLSVAPNGNLWGIAGDIQRFDGKSWQKAPALAGAASISAGGGLVLKAGECAEAKSQVCRFAAQQDKAAANQLDVVVAQTSKGEIHVLDAERNEWMLMPSKAVTQVAARNGGEIWALSGAKPVKFDGSVLSVVHDLEREELSRGPQGDATGVVAMTSHRGRLYAVADGKLLVRMMLGPRSGKAWKEVGDARGLTALASFGKALYGVSGSQMMRWEKIAKGKAEWKPAGSAPSALLAGFRETLVSVRGERLVSGTDGGWKNASVAFDLNPAPKLKWPFTCLRPLRAIFDEVKGVFKPVVDRVSDLGRTIYKDYVAEKLPGILDEVVQWFLKTLMNTKLGNRVKQALAMGMVDYFDRMDAKLREAADKVRKGEKPTALAKNALNDLMDGLPFLRIGFWVTLIKDPIKEALVKAVNYIGDKAIYLILAAVRGILVNLVIKAVNWAVSSLVPAIVAVVTVYVGGSGGVINTITSTVANVAVTLIRWAWDKIIDPLVKTAAQFILQLSVDFLINGVGEYVFNLIMQHAIKPLDSKIQGLRRDLVNKVPTPGWLDQIMGVVLKIYNDFIAPMMGPLLKHVKTMKKMHAHLTGDSEDEETDLTDAEENKTNYDDEVELIRQEQQMQFDLQKAIMQQTKGMPPEEKEAAAEEIRKVMEPEMKKALDEQRQTIAAEKAKVKAKMKELVEKAKAKAQGAASGK
jgi:hypothetical protein